MQINLCEMFRSFDGEVNKFGQGTPSIFIRFQGCNLKCKWCDTRFAQEPRKGDSVPIEQIVKEVKDTAGYNKVTITGGEPLLQSIELKALVRDLFYEGIKISVETNGSKPWGIIDEPDKYWVHSWVIDYKLPGSGQERYMLMPEYFGVNTKDSDFVKFVIDDHKDLMRAIEIQAQMVKAGANARFAYSTTTRHVSHFVLAEWMEGHPEILDKAILNVQLHKIIWPETRRR